MTIRDAIDQLLTGETPLGGGAADPASVMAEHGYETVPTELFGTALVHFADTAPLEQADALAPVVTRVGPIPLEESDLPESYGELDLDAIEGDDAFALFSEAAPVVAESPADELDFEAADTSDFEVEDLNAAADAEADSNDDVDPEDIDIDKSDPDTEVSSDTDAPDNNGPVDTDSTEPSTVNTASAEPSTVNTDPSTVNTASTEDDDTTGDPDSGFGEGVTIPQALPDSGIEVLLDEEDLDDFDLDALAPKFDPAEPVPLDDGLGGIDDDLLEDEGVDLFSVEFDESDQADVGIDPNDLDFGGE